MSVRPGDDPTPRAGEGGAYRKTPTQLATDPAFTGTYANGLRARLGSRWVALGDSITQGTSNARWTDAVQFLSLGRLQLVNNAGIAGNTAAQMLARFDTDVTPYAPNVVTILAGTNDTGVTALSSYQTMVKALVAKCQSIGAVPVLFTLPPNGTGSPANRKQQITLFNTWLSRYARDTGLPLVDLYSLLVDPATGAYLSAYNGDGTHPSPAGYGAIGQAVVTALSGILPPYGTPLLNDAIDPNNLVLNPLFLSDSSQPGVHADQWSNFGSGATFTLNKADAAIKGNWQTWSITTGGPTGILNALNGYVPIAGHTYALFGLFQTSGVAAGAALTVALQVDGTSVAFPLSSYQPATAKGAFYTEYTVASGAHTNLRVLATVAGGAITTGLAQVGVYDLTALGLA